MSDPILSIRSLPPSLPSSHWLLPFPAIQPHHPMAIQPHLHTDIQPHLLMVTPPLNMEAMGATKSPSKIALSRM